MDVPVTPIFDRLPRTIHTEPRPSRVHAAIMKRASEQRMVIKANYGCTPDAPITTEARASLHNERPCHISPRSCHTALPPPRRLHILQNSFQFCIIQPWRAAQRHTAGAATPPTHSNTADTHATPRNANTPAPHSPGSQAPQATHALWRHAHSETERNCHTQSQRCSTRRTCMRQSCLPAHDARNAPP